MRKWNEKSLKSLNLIFVVVNILIYCFEGGIYTKTHIMQKISTKTHIMQKISFYALENLWDAIVPLFISSLIPFHLKNQIIEEIKNKE